MTTRVGPFITIGALGFVLQMTVLAALANACHWPYLAATAVAVEAAVLHNFAWHERWTWSDRVGASGVLAVLARLARFQVGTGLASIGGNIVMTAAFVELLHLPAIVANAAAVGVTSIANFIIADRWVFKAPAVATFAALLLVIPRHASGAELRNETLAAWNNHVAVVEANLDASTARGPLDEPVGRSIAVAGGVIHEWRGAVRLPGITVGELVEALEKPGLPPPADDVLEARVLGRHGDDAVHVYLKLARSAIITVVYDTEHDVTFQRVSSGLATSRSVSTTIREVGGSDRGFLWRLNSYWRYRQDGDGVLVEVLSVSLSRTVPAVARPVATPIIDRIARESMRRTLEAMERFGVTIRQRRLAAATSPTR
jgi:putative flippase GtrA